MEIKNLFKTFATRERDGPHTEHSRGKGDLQPRRSVMGSWMENRGVRPSRVGDFCGAEFTGFLLKAGQGDQLSVMGRFPHPSQQFLPLDLAG